MKISSKKSKSKIFSTACQDYSPEMKEYVFAIKGRPFAMLSSQKLPVPPVSLIDYNLVRDLGLEMQDLQCTKYTFGGLRLRVLGRISQTVQTIQDGAISGTAHVRANVVENLYQAFETHSVAGQQMITSLMSSPATPDVVAPPSPTPTKSPRLPRGSQVAATPELSVSTLAGAPDTSVSPQLITKYREFNEDFVDSSGDEKYSEEELSEEDELYSEEEQSSPGASDHPKEPKDFYGRVIKVRKGTATDCYGYDYRSLAEVDYEAKGKIFTNRFLAPKTNPRAFNKLKVGDAVLCRHYDGWDEARKAGHETPFSLIKVYTEPQVDVLRYHGAVFPDVPPDLHPSGYYG